jgi:hypothetical protein
MAFAVGLFLVILIVPIAVLGGVTAYALLRLKPWSVAAAVLLEALVVLDASFLLLRPRQHGTVLAMIELVSALSVAALLSSRSSRDAFLHRRRMPGESSVRS